MASAAPGHLREHSVTEGKKKSLHSINQPTNQPMEGSITNMKEEEEMIQFVWF
jgi:hypothetical protein